MRRPSRPAMVLLAVIVLVAVGLALIWRFSPAEDWLTAERLAHWGWAFRGDEWLPFAILVCFILGQQVAFPLTVLVVAAALLLGPWEGFLWSYVGTLIGAVLSFAIGYRFGGRALRRYAGRRVNRISRLMASRGVTSMTIINLLPVGPHTLINLVAGSSHVSFRDFILGTALGVWPSLLAIALLAHQLLRLLEEPAFENAVATVIILAAIAAGSWLGYQWLRRKVPPERV